MPANVKSIEELSSGVAKVHKGLAKQLPGAFKIAPEFREMTRGMNVQEMLDAYNRAQMFGKTQKGEPVRASIISEPTSRSARRMQSGRLPVAAEIVLNPESTTVGELGRAPLSRFTAELGEVAADPSAPLTAEFMRRSGPGTGAYEIGAMEAGAGYGSPHYQLMYDLINASGDVNRADTLTDINAIRRLHNVMSHGMGRGTYGGIVPVAESGSIRTPSGRQQPISYSKQLFNRPVSFGHKDEESMALQNLIPNVDLYTQAMHLNPSDLANMTDDQITGLLATREAQLASAYGPGTSTGSTLRMRDLAPGDTEALREIAKRHQYRLRADSPGTMQAEAAIGPQTMGRQITTEIAIQRILRGDSPEDIVRDIIKSTQDPEAAFKGRYAEGGLAHATVD